MVTDKFTTYLKDTFLGAWQCAEKLSHQKVQPAHLLFSLCAQKGSIGAELLRRDKIFRTQIKQWMDENYSSDKVNDELVSSDNVVNLINKTVLLANANRHKYVGTEHLLATWLDLYGKMIPKIVDKPINVKKLRNQVAIILKSSSKFPDIVDAPNESNNSVNKELKDKSKTPALDFFGRELTNKAVQDKIDPVIGRDQEISRLIQILTRRTKNNPILLGDPGVGKTAIVEGLAKKMLLGDVPDVLLGKKIFALDLTALVAGTIYRGEFENRLNQVVEEIKKYPELILFIDEVHTIIGAGSASGSMDAANILKPALARGELRCIGATTHEEYKKHIEADAALERRFQPIDVDEPSLDKTLEILQGIKQKYETYHAVHITDEALQSAATLADRYVKDKFMPDKAIDLVDEAASAIRVNLPKDSLSRKQKQLEHQLERFQLSKQRAVRKEDFAKAKHFKLHEQEILIALQNIKNEQAKRSQKPVGTINKKDIAKVVSKITGVPIEELLQEEKERLMNLEEILQKNVIGQNKAVNFVATAIKRSRAGIASPDRPIGSFIFLGPTGVGKTHLAKTLAATIFQDKDALVRIDMSEFSEAFSISKLIGAPAGYVGYRESGKLTDAVKRKPYAVVLLDELEKAHPDIFNLLLQILEDGQLTDATGKTIDFRNTIIIMTSNIGSGHLLNQSTIGFHQADNDQPAHNINVKEVKRKIQQDLEGKFRPEFLNRIDKTVVFQPLSIESLKTIAAIQINELVSRLAEQGVSLSVTEAIVDQISEHSFNPKEGARAIRRIIQEQIEAPLADLLLKDKSEGIKIVGEKRGNQFDFMVK